MHRTLSSWMWILQVHGQMGRVYQYMNQEKLNLYDEKTLKKNIGTRKTYYIWEEGGGGGQPDPRKKNCECWSLFYVTPPPCHLVCLYLLTVVIQGKIS